MKELSSEVAGDGEDSQQFQPKIKNPIVRTGRPVLAEQPSGSSAQEIDKRFLRGCDSTDVSFERSDRDKDADEKVDADQVRTGRPHLVRLLRRSKKMSCFGCESTNVSTERLAKSCVPVSVERVDKNKDADENVDADQTSTERPVSGQSIGLFTQREEIDIDFRVSGYCHMQL